MDLKWDVEFQVIGTPAPQGSKRHVGNGVMIESCKEVKPWREAVKWAALGLPADQRVVLRGPIVAEMIFTIRKPKSAPKRRVTYPDRKPDGDKLERSTLDAIVKSGLIEDDGRIISNHWRKVFPGEDTDSLPVPGAIIRLRKVIP